MNRFNGSFDKFACVGDSITAEIDGLTVVARIEQDDCTPPWEAHDGHGVVSDYTTRAKEPGERVLCGERRHYRYYDVKQSMAIAKRDGWDAEPYKEGTKGQQAARAVEADFQALRAWCNDEWFWCCIILSVEKNGVDLDRYAVSLGMIDCNYPGGDNGHLTECANELLDEALEVGKAAIERLTA